MSYVNFYTIVGGCGLILWAVAVYYIVWVMQYQNAATPYPPTGTSSLCPDNWTLDEMKWCIIPPSPTYAKENANSNLGTVHGDKTYATLLASVPGVHRRTTTTKPETGAKFETAGIKPTHFEHGEVSINFTAADLCAKKAWATKFGVSWDGVTNSTAC